MSERVQIIGAGFGRTGTMSLKGALQGLGFDPCYHMIETFERPDHCALWLEAERGERVDWQVLLAGYLATVDWPGCRFYRQLMETFPEAKVILTVRDPESWYESVKATIHTRPAGREPQPDDDVRTQMVRAVVWEGSLEGRFDDRTAAIDIFRRHIDEVKDTVPADRLLVFEVKQGWGPLCDFLSVERPAAPFPHLNEAKVFNDPDAFGEMVSEMRSQMT